MKTDLLNGGLLILALVTSGLAVVWQVEQGDPNPEIARVEVAEHKVPEELIDARGVVVKTGDYQRIVSLNTVGDHLLLNLVEPERLVAITGYTHEGHDEAWRFGERSVLKKSQDVEQILGLRPDLVVTSEFADESFMARIREQGIPVFDLGNMRGIASTLEDIEVLGQLLNQPERALDLQESYRRELAGLLSALPEGPQPPGVYVTVLADSFFGGTQGTSYADVMHYGGIHDLAAEKGHQDWPRYTPEQLLMMNPKLILTQEGMGEILCGHSALSNLAACHTGGRILELHGRYHADPGLGIVQAAQQVQMLMAKGSRHSEP